LLCPNLCPPYAKSQFKAKFEANLGAKQQAIGISIKNKNKTVSRSGAE